MAEPFLSEIRLFSFLFAPQGWAMCDGQLMPISQNTALFALIGTFYGGNGVSTFALPDLQGRVAIHQGTNAGTTYVIGEQGGEETHTLLTSEIPSHSHTLSVAGTSTTSDPTGALFAQPASNPHSGGLYSPTSNSVAGPVVGVAGGSQPHENQMPFLVLNYSIALEGIFPSRS
jgi:microcystin-dependent protein